ncbi:hypothetical protein, partial [uncultured Oscillibacter sp.]|uniref:hypothetical protein n=1 Tax=uncultured Oscillibacter sp. TaxID=876091 RepID=UPI002615B548
PLSVLLFTCLRRPVFRCPKKTLILLGFLMFSYGNALEVRDFYLHLFCQCKLVETTGLELPALRLSHVKGCSSQIDAKETKTFHVTSYPMFLCDIPLQRETTGKKNS